MPDIWAELDADAIAEDEIKGTILLALVALKRNQTPAMATPLQRLVARTAGPIWLDQENRQADAERLQRRALIAAMRARVRH